MTIIDTAIAASRFGLGARPGELAKLGSDPRGTLMAQIRGPAPVIAESLPSSSELLAKVIAQRNARREAGEAPPARRSPASNQPNAAAPGDPPAESVVAIAKGLRDIYLPAYVGDVNARFRAAVTSERSFLERLVHFWSNHFAVSVDKLVVLGLAGPMEREAIRPHVLGKFSDMLLAVEQHPAMLLYLDNAQSVGPDSRAAGIAGRRGRKVGLNENLGREILELHTLGVDAGYTQDDVRALASIITGWSIGGNLGRLQGGEPGAFYFREILHQPGKQVLLGKTYRQDGIEQGEAALHDLAVNPHTARHISTKLARHFIADDPPDAAVSRLTAAFEQSRGDLPTVYRALLESPEAWLRPPPSSRRRRTTCFPLIARWTCRWVRAGATCKPSSFWGSATFSRVLPRDGRIAVPTGMVPRRCSSASNGRRQLGQKLGADHNALQVAEAALGPALHADTRRSIERAQDGPQALTLLLSSPDFMRR